MSSLIYNILMRKDIDYQYNPNFDLKRIDTQTNKQYHYYMKFEVDILISNKRKFLMKSEFFCEFVQN